MEWIKNQPEGPQPQRGEDVLVVMKSPQGPRVRHVHFKGKKVACFNENQSWAWESCLYWMPAELPPLD